MRLCRPISVQYLFGTFAGLIKMSATIQRPLDQLVPSGLNTEQQVFNENHILLQARKTELRACLLQSQDLFSVCVHLIHKHLNRHKAICFFCALLKNQQGVFRTQNNHYRQRLSTINTLCSSIWKSTVSSKRLGGWAIFRVCSACVNQLIVSWREDWKPVAKATASSNFACKVYVIQVT